MAAPEATGGELAEPILSIRVATTLLERFHALIHRGSEDLELVIGEADQLYPEIWRHLDDAARALTAAGRDTRTFDAIRIHELARFGVTDVDVTGYTSSRGTCGRGSVHNFYNLPDVRKGSVHNFYNLLTSSPRSPAWTGRPSPRSPDVNRSTFEHKL